MTDNLKLIILDAAIITFVIIIIIILLILKHKEKKKSMNEELKPGTFSGDPKDHETSITNEIDYLDDMLVCVETDKWKQIKKKLAILDRLQMILGAKNVDDLPNLALKIDNKCHSACYELEQAQSKLKALEIIKEYFIFSDDAYDKVLTPKKPMEKEKIDLLKEVLL